jgi:hypothetical protein
MTTIRAEIIGSDRCDAEGHTVRAAAPVLAMCRKLLTAGYDPNRPLNAYRGNVLALRVCPIGEGAKLMVEDGPSGPHFRPYRGRETTAAASLVRYSERPVSVALST